MALCLFTFGAATGCIEVAMNLQAVAIQNQYGRHIMSSFHGLFSTGGILGAIGPGLLMNMGLSPYGAITCISVLLIIIAVSQVRHLPEIINIETESNRLVLPGGPVLMLGIMCFMVAMVEGSMLDWSAVFLKDYRHVSPSFSGVGLAIFSVAMAAIRLAGDRIVNRIGSAKIILFGCIITAAGLVMAVSIPNLTGALTGFALIGIGCANIVPVFFSIAGKMKGPSTDFALPAVITMSYAGILAGPAIIGFIAQFSSLSFSLGFMALFLVIVAVSFKENK